MMIDNDDNEYFTPHGPIAWHPIAADRVVGIDLAREGERDRTVEISIPLGRPYNVECLWPVGSFKERHPDRPRIASGHATACVPGKCAAHCPQVRPIPK